MERSDQEVSVKEMWDEAKEQFEAICGESLLKGDVKGFHDVQTKIESASKASYGNNAKQDDKWEKAKSVGLKSLKYLKLLVNAASQASSVIPIPSSAVSITSSALCFVFDIPGAIEGYNDAIDQVFGEVSSALSQFHIYMSMQNVEPELIRRIHLVMTSFVRLCAHVVKYRQGGKRHRARQQIKSIFSDNSDLDNEMAKFKQALQQQRDVEGTVTLAVVLETHHDVQSFKDDVDRSKTLIKIRDALGVPATVRLDTNTTQTCTNISERCQPLTGSWIWTHVAYTAWVAPNKGNDASHVLTLSGPASSGKTSVSALITKHLEEQKGRTYVAHYFFPPSTKKSDDEKISQVHSAIKYMAFQIARVDVTVQKRLGKACDAGPGAFRRLGTLGTLDALWAELKIGTPGSGSIYYLVFDGLENLPDKQAEMLLKFVFSSKLAEESAGRVRILVSGTDDQFINTPKEINTAKVLRIQMEEHNASDMRIVVDEALTKRGMLENAKPGSVQQSARDKIVEKLPQNVGGSYSRLQLGLDDVFRLLSTRTAAQELDNVLSQLTNSHEVAIKNLQRSLTGEEISELNELLKWVLFPNVILSLEQLEAAMFLYSGTESIASLQFIIKNKYSTVLRVENGFVYDQDGVKDYLLKDKDVSGKLSQSKDRPTISMTITINNVDQELCGHFLWDLAHKAIRDKFKFDFDAASPNSALRSSNQATITVDEFEAHHTIVSRAFKYLSEDHKDQTKEIGAYLVGWLPNHLGRLRQLEGEDKGSLTPSEQIEIGQNLYELFKDEKVFLRHKASFQETRWFVDEMEGLQKWLMDWAVTRKLDEKWRKEVQLLVSPTRSFLKELVKLVVEGLLRERSWEVNNAYRWINEFMELDEKVQKAPQHLKTEDENSSRPSSPSVISSVGDVDWDRVSAWCQDFLGLPDSELNSLWYERLAEAASSQKCKAYVILSLYERAIEEGNPSWLCYRGLGETYYIQGWTEKAIEHVELALGEAEQENATPKPEAKDIIGLHMLLGQYAYEAGNGQRATEHYLFACKSEDTALAIQGKLGHLKAGLNFMDTEVIRQTLKQMLANEAEEEAMVSVLKMIARDTEHEILISKMFAIAKEDPDLFRRIIRAMETATTTHTPSEFQTTEITDDRLFAEEEARGVLLYDRGVAAYTYKVTSNNSGAIEEALRLWEDSRYQLSKVGGRNALVTRQNATAALARYYFQGVMDKSRPDYADELAKLAKADSTVYSGEAVGFLGTVYATQGELKKAREVLTPRMKQALGILSDDTPDNDGHGVFIIEKTLEYYQDFKNAAIALSLLGTPDLVTGTLVFDASDIIDDDVDKQRLLGIIDKLAQETIQVAKTQVPNTSQQIQRIQAAKAYVESRITAAEAKTRLETDRDYGEDERSESQNRQDELAASELDTAFALDLIDSRLDSLQQVHLPKINASAFSWYWYCDGLAADGKKCDKVADFGHEFYNCTYCSDRVFCSDCLKRLRAPGPDAIITACSAKHRWLRTPPLGDAMYVGLNSKSVRVPREVRATKDDEMILEICYDEHCEEITVEAWKEKLAKDWDISLEEIRKDVSRQATPDEGDQDEKENEG